MPAIGEIMTHMHRDCDRHFADAESAVARGEWGSGATCFALFASAMRKHFEAEETILFPAFEKETGGEMGPTHVMSIEHMCMRDLMHDLATVLELHDSDGYLELADTLFVMLQQHNVKEERVLYPMMTETFGERSDALSAQIEGLSGQSRQC